jgi:hypothetical protein
VTPPPPGQKPAAQLLTALPLLWGEGDTSDVIAGRARRSAVLDGIAIKPVDSVTPATLGTAPLIIAQPRLLSPGELAALDRWVRDGGRALIFADPALAWPSVYPLGDGRRAPPVTLLDPLLRHWGLDLLTGAPGTSALTIDGFALAVRDAGRWRVPRWCALPDALVADAVVADCRIGHGHVILIADADMLDARLSADQGTATAGWLRARLSSFDAPVRIGANRRAIMIGVALLLAGFGAFLIWVRRRKQRT